MRINFQFGSKQHERKLLWIVIAVCVSHHGFPKATQNGSEIASVTTYHS